MAWSKKESEGIALLSMYGDEEEEDEEKEDDIMEDIESSYPPQNDDVLTDPNTAEEDEIRTLASDSTTNTPSPLPPPPQPHKHSLNDNFTPSPQPHQLEASVSDRRQKGTLTIVDYGHDEVAMSPEPEEGEITTMGRVMFGEQLQMANGDFQEKTPPGTVQVLTPSTQATPQLSEQHDPSQSDAVNYAVNELDSAEVEEAIKISLEQPKDVDPLDKFLPPPPKDKCSGELQERIIRFLAVKKKFGRSFNAEVRNKKEYRNPDFLLHAVTYQDIDQIGSCFSKDVFDPHGYDKSDYFDAIEVDMRRETERKEQEKKKNQMVEFHSGGTQPGTVAHTPKVSMPMSGLPTVASGALHSVPAAVDAVARDGRQNKKSKWDKVDGDRRNPMATGEQDSVSAALISGASAGTGYTAFAQQRRREAEEKRYSEKKLERRS